MHKITKFAEILNILKELFELFAKAAVDVRDILLAIRDKRAGKNLVEFLKAGCPDKFSALDTGLLILSSTAHYSVRDNSFKLEQVFAEGYVSIINPSTFWDYVSFKQEYVRDGIFYKYVLTGGEDGSVTNSGDIFGFYLAGDSWTQPDGFFSRLAIMIEDQKDGEVGSLDIFRPNLFFLKKEVNSFMEVTVDWNDEKHYWSVGIYPRKLHNYSPGTRVFTAWRRNQ